MEQNEKVAKKSKLSKKTLRKEIYQKLQGVLSDYQKEVTNKKLLTHMKRASKLLSRDIAKVAKKAKQKKEKTAQLSAAK
ncbi:MAG: hypothetical protein JST75_08020 [Bacteroidetes bacterium]|nr:hypothetical protein [Bacteroidota bacterium]